MATTATHVTVVRSQSVLRSLWRHRLRSLGSELYSAASFVPVTTYGYGATAACHAIAARGIAILREAQDDRALAVWLRSLADGTPTGASALDAPPSPLLASGEESAPRRYDDAALTDFANLSSTIACECPATSPNC